MPIPLMPGATGILGQLDKKELKAVPIHELIPYDKNPRKNADAVDKVASSLKEFGLVKNSVICDENMVLITGHTTVKAMQKLGWDKVPEVTQVSGLTDNQKKAYRIADNKLGEIAEWDLELLIPQLQELKLDDMLEFTGFDDIEFDGMIAGLNDDAPPALNSDPRSDFTPSYLPQFSAPHVTDADIQTSDRKLEQITHKPVTKISAFCPKCGHEFEIGG